MLEPLASCVKEGRCKPTWKREFKTPTYTRFKDFYLKTLALTVLYVPCSLDSGQSATSTSGNSHPLSSFETRGSTSPQ